MQGREKKGSTGGKKNHKLKARNSMCLTFQNKNDI